MSDHLHLTILYIIGGLLVFELLLFYVLTPLFKYLHRLGSPVRTVRARVLLTESRMTALLPWWLKIPIGTRYGRFGGWLWPGQLEDSGKQFSYWIFFEVDDSRLEFQVSEEQFGQFEQDDAGELSYQADKVLAFKVERSEDSETN